jgi:hypothetical protein
MAPFLLCTTGIGRQFWIVIIISLVVAKLQLDGRACRRLTVGGSFSRVCHRKTHLVPGLGIEMPTKSFYMRSNDMAKYHVRLPSPDTINSVYADPIRRNASLVVRADVHSATFESHGWIQERLKGAVKRVFKSTHGIDNSSDIRLHVILMVSESNAFVRTKSVHPGRQVVDAD